MQAMNSIDFQIEIDIDEFRIEVNTSRMVISSVNETAAIDLYWFKLDRLISGCGTFISLNSFLLYNIFTCSHYR